MKNLPKKTIVIGPKLDHENKLGVIYNEVDYISFARIPDLNELLGTVAGQEIFMGIS
jgi:hypothetical protein